MIFGLDCASVDKNKNPNWGRAKAEGPLSFALLRASYGRTPDSRFAHDWPEIKMAGLTRGAYLFLRFPKRGREAPPDPDVQAQALVDTVGALDRTDFPVTIDVEFPDGGRVDTGMTSAQALDWVRAAWKVAHDAYGVAPMLYTSRRTAELIKYAANAFLATKITFINEIADLCERVGADVQEVARGIGLDNRIGSKFLHAGPGYGGSCFPKDVRALIKTAQDYDVPMRILEAVESVNDTRKRAMARKVAAAFSGVLRGKTVAVLGLTFKPNTDDMREAPSIPLIVALQDMGAKVRVHDPEGMQQARQVLTDVTYCDGPYDCVEEADAAVIVTEWEQFRALDFDRLKDLMACPVIVDLRNIYRPEDMQRQGFAYTCVGRSSAFQPAAVYVPTTRSGRSSAESPA